VVVWSSLAVGTQEGTKLIYVPNVGEHVTITHMYRSAPGSEPQMYTDTGRITAHVVHVDDSGSHVVGVVMELDDEEAEIQIAPINFVEVKPYL
jgi:hypothetical protein